MGEEEKIGDFVYRPSKAELYVARLHRVSTGSFLEVSVEADSVALAQHRLKKMYPGWRTIDLKWSW